MSQSASEWNSKWLSHNVHTTYNYSHLSPSYLLCLSMSHPHLPLWPSFYPTVALSALWFLLRPLFFSIIFSMPNFFLTHLLSIHTVKFSHYLTHSLLFFPQLSLPPHHGPGVLRGEWVSFQHASWGWEDWWVRVWGRTLSCFLLSLLFFTLDIHPAWMPIIDFS